MRAGVPSFHAVLALLAVGLGLLMLAWVLGSPPGEGPDERAHYVKAIAAGEGELVGETPPGLEAVASKVLEGETKPATSTIPTATLNSLKELGFSLKATREYTIPRKLAPSFACSNLLIFRHPELPVRCRARPLKSRPDDSADSVAVGTHEGTYPPFMHVVPGLLMRTGDDDYTAFRIGRLASAAISLLLIVVALAVLWDPAAPGLSLLGAIVALTPMTLFVSSMLNPSGPEIAAGICFAAALLRLTRAPPAPRWVWVPLAVSGATLAVARPLGPIFVPVMIVAVVLLAGPRAALTPVLRDRRLAVGALAGIVAALGVGLFWELRYQTRPGWSLSGVFDAIGPSVGRVPDVLREMVGLFSVEYVAPASVYVPWALLFIALLAVSLAVGTPGQRLRLVLLTVGGLVLVLLLAALHREATGSDQFKGRYALPFFALVPLYAGEVIRSRRERLAPALQSRLVLGTAVAAGVLQVVAWWAAARRVAVGTEGPLFFVGDATWRPPAGWTPWIVLALAGAAAYALGAALADRRERTS